MQLFSAFFTQQTLNFANFFFNFEKQYIRKSKYKMLSVSSDRYCCWFHWRWKLISGKKIRNQMLSSFYLYETNKIFLSNISSNFFAIPFLILLFNEVVAYGKTALVETYTEIYRKFISSDFFCKSLNKINFTRGFECYLGIVFILLFND